MKIKKIKSGFRIKKIKNKGEGSPGAKCPEKGDTPHDSGDAPTIPVDARHKPHNCTKTKGRVIYR